MIWRFFSFFFLFVLGGFSWENWVRVLSFALCSRNGHLGEQSMHLRSLCLVYCEKCILIFDFCFSLFLLCLILCFVSMVPARWLLLDVIMASGGICYFGVA